MARCRVPGDGAMKLPGRRRLFFLLVQIAVGGVFLYAGMLKIGDPRGFAEGVAAYRLLPPFGNLAVAAVLPWIEVAAGALLMAGVLPRGAAVVTLILDAVFLAALGSAVARGLDIDCGCFRKSGSGTPVEAIVRDLFLAAGALMIILEERTRRITAAPPDAGGGSLTTTGEPV